MEMNEIIAKFEKLEKEAKEAGDVDAEMANYIIKSKLKEAGRAQEEKQRMLLTISELQNKIGQLEENARCQAGIVNDQLRKAFGVVLAVKAMLKNSGGCTHRQRDFFRDSIIKYIEEVESSMSPVMETRTEKEDTPF